MASFLEKRVEFFFSNVLRIPHRPLYRRLLLALIFAGGVKGVVESRLVISWGECENAYFSQEVQTCGVNGAVRGVNQLRNLVHLY